MTVNRTVKARCVSSILELLQALDELDGKDYSDTSDSIFRGVLVSDIGRRLPVSEASDILRRLKRYYHKRGQSERVSLARRSSASAA